MHTGLPIALVLALPLMACSSQAVREEPPLPFHVVVLPATAHASASAPEAEADVAEDVQLAFSGAEVSRGVAGRLSTDTFTRVTTVDYPAEMELDAFLALPQSERDRHWDAVIRELEPDLVIALRLNYSPTVLSDTNSYFWGNAALFLLGGPFCWIVNDRDYFTNAELQAAVYDGSLIRTQQASYGDSEPELMISRGDVPLKDLDFVDRAGGNIGQYALSIVCPAGWLATESEGTRTSLQSAILDDLTTKLARDLRVRSTDLTRATQLYDFYIRPENVRVVTAGSGHELRGDVFLETNRGTDRMDDFAFVIDGREVAGEFGTPELDPDEGLNNAVMRFPFRVPIAGSRLPDEVRVVFRDQAQRERSHTFNARAIEAVYRK